MGLTLEYMQFRESAEQSLLVAGIHEPIWTIQMYWFVLIWFSSC